MAGLSFEIETELGEDDTQVIINVFGFVHQPPHKGSAWACDSSDDYYGYTDYDFSVTIKEDGKPYTGHIDPFEIELLILNYFDED